MQIHINRVHTCLAVTSHLHFWQNDWDLFFYVLLRYHRWNRYRKEKQNSQHGKLNLEKKIILPGLEPPTF